MLVVSEREQLPVSQARAGESWAWNALFRRYQLPLYVYIFEFVHDVVCSRDLSSRPSFFDVQNWQRENMRDLENLR